MQSGVDAETTSQLGRVRRTPNRNACFPIIDHLSNYSAKRRQLKPDRGRGKVLSLAIFGHFIAKMGHERAPTNSLAQLPSHLVRSDTEEPMKRITEVGGIAVAQFDGDLFERRVREQAPAGKPHPHLQDHFARACGEFVIE